MKRLMSLAVALALCAGAPAAAYAASQPSDTQTGEVEVVSTTAPVEAAKGTQGTTQASATPKTGDPVSLAVPAVLAGAALVVGGVAVGKARRD